MCGKENREFAQETMFLRHKINKQKIHIYEAKVRTMDEDTCIARKVIPLTKDGRRYPNQWEVLLSSLVRQECEEGSRVATLTYFREPWEINVLGMSLKKFQRCMILDQFLIVD